MYFLYHLSTSGAVKIKNGSIFRYNIIYSDRNGGLVHIGGGGVQTTVHHSNNSAYHLTVKH